MIKNIYAINSNIRTDNIILFSNLNCILCINSVNYPHVLNII